MRALAVDFGSTYTKVTAIEVPDAPGATDVHGAEPPRILGTASAFTTIESDVQEGLDNALHCLHERMGGPFHYDTLLCCSSAAGGLAMVALGLVPELTAKAARMAAENAGAKVMRTFAFEVSPAELDEIRALKPDLILLCGGTDGGNKDVILRNARHLASLEGHFSLIAAGNKCAAAELEDILRHSGKRYIITDNVMPSFGKLNVEPAQQRIRELFIERIIEAKGLSRIQAQTPHAIIPTPLAVLKGCELLSRGTSRSEGLGDIMAVDLGGATTDVYSMSKGEPTLDNVVLKGMPEPYAKRTVEGDLGMRYSLPFLLEEVGADLVAQLASELASASSTALPPVHPDDVCQWVALCRQKPATLAPAGSPAQRMDEALARCAIAAALTRHCGVLEKIYTPMGEMFTLTGKDLSAVPLLIGIGGALRHSSAPKDMLGQAVQLAGKMAPDRMLPRGPHCSIDGEYIISALGLLSTVAPEAALAILKQHIQPFQRT